MSVKPSDIEALGIFATRSFHAGELSATWPFRPLHCPFQSLRPARMSSM